jgi:eukaryotic-like serine/threonine-protein kinase
VLAVVESRLNRLESEARRVARAASVFGEVFWREGVAALLGASTSPRDLQSWLQILTERELFVEARESRFSGEPEYKFAHSLLREAAYAMLGNDDRRKGHALAGSWLESAGQKDALVLAAHFEQAGEHTRAVPWLLRAAQVAAEGGNVTESIRLAGRGIACGAQSGERGQLRLVQAMGNGTLGDWSACVDAARDALAQLEAGSTSWFRAVATLLMAGSFLNDSGLTEAALQEMRRVNVQPESSGPYGYAIYQVFQGLTRIGKIAAAREVLDRAELLIAEPKGADPMFVLWLRNARVRAELIDGNLASALAHARDANELAERIGAGHVRASTGLYWITALAQTGHVERTAEAARALIAFCDPNGQQSAIDWATYFLAWARVAVGDTAEAIAPLRQLLDRSDVFLVSSVHAVLSQALLARDQLDEAEREADLASIGMPFAWSQATGLRARALVQLRLNRPESALELAERGLAAAAQGSHPLTVSILQLVRAEALWASGRSAEARRAITAAHDRVQRMAAALDELELRTAHLERIQAHVRTLALAAAWLPERE